jgi:hypothetical protein
VPALQIFSKNRASAAAAVAVAAERRNLIGGCDFVGSFVALGGAVPDAVAMASVTLHAGFIVGM